MARQQIGIDFEVIGDRELTAAFENLNVKLQKKIARKALRASVKVIHKRIRQLAPRRKKQRGKPNPSRGLWKKIKVRALKRSRTRIGVGIVTPTRAMLGLSPSDGYYPAFMALGFTHKRSGRKVEPRRFMRQGFDERKGLALKVLRSSLREQIGAEWAKGGK